MILQTQRPFKMHLSDRHAPGLQTWACYWIPIMCHLELLQAPAQSLHEPGHVWTLKTVGLVTHFHSQDSNSILRALDIPGNVMYWGKNPSFGWHTTWTIGKGLRQCPECLLYPLSLLLWLSYNKISLICTHPIWDTCRLISPGLHPYEIRHLP